MPGIVSIIDGAVGDYVRDCWQLLTRELGIVAAPPGAVPHITYYVTGESFDSPPVFDAVEILADTESPFSVQVTGLGVFAGEPAVLYLAVTRNEQLSALYRRAWALGEANGGPSPAYFEEERWVPHITLAMDGLTTELTARAIGLLVPRIAPMEAAINNLAVIDERSGAHELVRRCNFPARMVQVQ